MLSGLLQGSANPSSIDVQQHNHWHAHISQLLETFKRDVLITRGCSKSIHTKLIGLIPA